MFWRWVHMSKTIMMQCFARLNNDMRGTKKRLDAVWVQNREDGNAGYWGEIIYTLGNSKTNVCKPDVRINDFYLNHTNVRAGCCIPPNEDQLHLADKNHAHGK